MSAILNLPYKPGAVPKIITYLIFMNKAIKPETEVLRQKADAKIRTLTFQRTRGVDSPFSRESMASEDEMLKLILELGVYLVELEKQNEELQLANELSEQAKNKYAELYDFASCGYLSVARSGIITELNFVAARMLGKERSRLINNTFSLCLSVETRPVFFSFLNNIFTNRTRQTCEVRITIKGSPSIYVSMDGIASPNGETCFLTLLDISGQRLTEEALAESIETFALILELSPIYTFIKEVTPMEGRMLRASQNYVEMIGIRGSDMVGKTMHELFPPALAAKIVADDWAVVSQGKAAQFDEELNGRSYTTIKYPISWRGKNLLAGYTIDITDRKHAELAMKAELERLKSINRILEFNTETVDEILNFAFEQAILLTNSKIGYLYLYEEQTLEFTLFCRLEEGMNEGSAKELKTKISLHETGIWGEAVRQKKPIIINDFNVPHLLKKRYPRGQSHLDKFLTIPVQFDAKIVAVIVVGNKDADYEEADVLHLTLLAESAWTSIQRKGLSEIQEKQNEELQQLNATKDKFLSIIAHDLKSPFNAILGFSEILMQQAKVKDYESIEEYAGIINESAKRAVSMQTDLLVWARTQSGRMEFKPEDIEMAQFIKDIALLYSDIAKQKSISITTTLPHLIPAFAYRPMISAVLGNLISNAIKFTPEGGEIRISAEQKQEGINISVTDNGIGIPSDSIGKLFRIEEGFSTKGTNNEEGTGLGLILCKEFVEKHGGKIGVESVQGKGSVFYITLPHRTIQEPIPDSHCECKG